MHSDRRDFLKTALLAAGATALTRRLLAQDGAPPADQPTLYCVGYAHLDTQWRWSYPIVIHEFLLSTLKDNFALFEKYFHYTFNFTGANRYRMMQEYHPKEFAQLQEYVKQGRWFTAGSCWEESLANEPSSESLLRQILYGNRWTRINLCQLSSELFFPDCFGFPASLPTLLAHAGLKGFSTQKLTLGCAAGIPFNVGVWTGPDGRSIVAALNCGRYETPIEDDLSHNQKWIDRVNADGKQSGVFVDYRYFGTGDTGGAPDESSVHWLEKSLSGNGPLKIVSATAAQMFEDLTPDQVSRLPRYQGELLLTQHSAGTASSQAFTKKLNRKHELRADEAERACAAADWLGTAPYPGDQIRNGWHLLLGGQFHDILAGTCKPDAMGYAWNDGFIARNLLTSARDNGVGAIASQLDTQTPGMPLVVFNPVSIDREDVVQAEIVFPGVAPEHIAVFDPTGQPVPAQITARDGNRLTLLFLARVPSVGFAVFDVRAAETQSPAASDLRVTASTLENHRYRVRLDTTGDITSFFDKAHHRELLSSPARLAFLRQNPTKYPAWNMDWSDASAPPYAHVDGPARIEIAEEGPVRVALRITRKAQGSTFIQTVRLPAGGAGDRVEFDTFIDWHTPASALKAVFPLTVSNPKATYNWGCGTVERETSNPKLFESPHHQWFDLTDSKGDYGVSILEDCKYGSDKPDDHTLRLTLLFTPGMARAQYYRDQSTQDFGRHQCLYALYGHSGDWRDGGTPWQAARLNQPLTAFQTDRHPGILGRTLPFCRLEGSAASQVKVQALKLAEDSNEIIIRLQELHGRPATKVRLAFRVPIASFREVDGQERIMDPSYPPMKGLRQIGVLDEGKLELDFPAYGLRAFAISLAVISVPPPAPPATQLVALSFNHRVTSRDHETVDTGMDVDHRCIPAEQFPDELNLSGIPFRFGPATNKNAISCQGQQIDLPSGSFDELHLICAARDGGVRARFKIDDMPIDLDIGHWTGFIGQPDYRLWDSNQIPDVTFDWDFELTGIAPGYLHQHEIAWCCSHTHTADGQNEPYQYCYLYRYRIPLRPGTRRLVLPDDVRIKIFAVTLSAGAGKVRPAAPDLDVI